MSNHKTISIKFIGNGCASNAFLSRHCLGGDALSIYRALSSMPGEVTFNPRRPRLHSALLLSALMEWGTLGTAQHNP